MFVHEFDRATHERRRRAERIIAFEIGAHMNLHLIDAIKSSRRHFIKTLLDEGFRLRHILGATVLWEVPEPHHRAALWCDLPPLDDLPPVR